MAVPQGLLGGPLSSLFGDFSEDGQHKERYIGCITHKARVNVSHETREVNVADIQPVHARPLPQFQVTEGFPATYMA